MPKREKRLEKGIESLEKQIKIHQEKMETAEGEENFERVKYYEKEINKFENVKRKKEQQFEKSK